VGIQQHAATLTDDDGRDSGTSKDFDTCARLDIEEARKHRPGQRSSVKSLGALLHAAHSYMLFEQLILR